MVTSIDVAKLFLSWANQEGDLITNLKMQKLLYYAQAWHLVHFNKPLFNDSIKAWSFGPVVLESYHSFKKFKHSPIRYEENGKETKVFDKNQLEFLQECYGVFVKFSAHQLVNIVHNEAPWKDVYEEGRSNEIGHKAMKDYYTKFLDKK